MTIKELERRVRLDLELLRFNKGNIPEALKRAIEADCAAYEQSIRNSGE
ncbi:MAG TPA: hypothetical protein VI756_03670 [Blastocatellia bacterium]